MSATINLWLHLLAFATYAGATVAVLLICLPLARGEEDVDRRRQIIVATMRIYDPLTIAALGVLVMTGAFNLTAYKAALQGLFFDRLGTLLAWKLLFTFILIILAAYIAFGIGHRIVRRADAGDPGDAVWLDRMLTRLRTSALLAVFLVAVIAWIALRMTHPGSLPTTQSQSAAPIVVRSSEGGEAHGAVRRCRYALRVCDRQDEKEQPVHDVAVVL